MMLLHQITYAVADFEVTTGCKVLRVHVTRGQVLAIQREQGLQPTQFYSEINGAAVKVSDVFCIVGVL